VFCSLTHALAASQGANELAVQCLSVPGLLLLCMHCWQLAMRSHGQQCLEYSLTTGPRAKIAASASDVLAPALLAHSRALPLPPAWPQTHNIGPCLPNPRQRAHLCHVAHCLLCSHALCPQLIALNLLPWLYVCITILNNIARINRHGIQSSLFGSPSNQFSPGKVDDMACRKHASPTVRRVTCMLCSCTQKLVAVLLCTHTTQVVPYEG
jgi:hypothetical protein